MPIRFVPGTRPAERGSKNLSLGKASCVVNGSAGSGEPWMLLVVQSSRFSRLKGCAEQQTAAEKWRSKSAGNKLLTDMGHLRVVGILLPIVSAAKSACHAFGA